MSDLMGLIGLTDRDTTLDKVGQRVIYDAVGQILNWHAMDLAKVVATFVQETTDVHSETYKMPASGEMQEVDEITRAGAFKAGGEYDVAYDLVMGRDQIASDSISLSYMTVADYDRHLKGVLQRNINWKRKKILRHLFNNTNEVFKDKIRGSLTIRRLANSDGTLYPAVIGTYQEAQANRYITSGYAASAISNVNNPFPKIREEFEKHYGVGMLVSFIHPDQREAVEALASFTEVTKMHVIPGKDRDLVNASGVPMTIPGVLLGTIDNILVYEWRFVPTGYIFTTDLSQKAPLKQRLDVPSGLRGFRMVMKDERYPLLESHFEEREGYGVAERLNGLVMELTADPTYDTPAIYA